MKQSRSLALILPIVLFALALYLPAFAVRGFTPSYDALRQGVPWFAFTRQELLAGRLPRWDPTRMAGAPHLANPQVGFWYPLTWLALPFPPDVAVCLLFIGNIALGGVLLALLGSNLGLSRMAATLAGMVYVTSGMAAGRTFAGHLEVLRAMAWAPLLLLAARRVAVDATPGWAACLGLATAMSLLAGHTNVTAYTLGAATFLFLTSLSEGRRPWRAAGLALLGLGLGVLVAAPALWGLLELAGQSVRSAGLPLDIAARGALRVRDLPLVIWPWLFGSLPMGNFWWSEGPFWHEMQSAGGVVVFSMALFGVLRRRHERVVWLLGLLAAGALLLSMGTLTPIYPGLVTLVAPLRSFRNPVRFLLIWTIVLPILAGMGFDESRRTRPLSLPWPFRHGLYLSLVVVVAEAGLLVVALFVKEIWRVATASMAGLLNLAVGIGALLLVRWVMRGRGGRGVRDVVLALAMLLELLLVALPTVYSTFDTRAGVVAEFGSANIQAMQQSDARVALGQEYERYANLGMLLGFRSVTAYEPLLLNRTTTLLRAGQGGDPSGWGSASNEIHLDRDGGVAFDVLGVGSFLVQHPDGAELRSRTSALPRLTLVEVARKVGTPDEALAAVLDARFDPRHAVVVETTPGTLQSTGASGVVQGVAIVDEQPGRLDVQVDAPQGGYLVFSESYYPGWRAEADGQDIALVPADYALMAVRLAPGHHRLVLRFTTPWLGPSLALSCLGIVGLAGLALASRRHTSMVRA